MPPQITLSTLRLPLALAALATLASPAQARAAQTPAAWLEVRSAHFVILSNAGEERARTVAEELERIRATLGRALDAGRGLDRRPRRPIIVFAVNGEGSLRELLPQYWERRGNRPVGAYAEAANAHYIVLRVDAQARERRRRALHEYIHLLIHTTLDEVPAWLDEGLSELWATAHVTDEAIEIGRPAGDHLRRLRRSRDWIPMRDLVAAQRPPDPGDSRLMSLFYSQAWALAHFVVLGGPTAAPELTPPAYLRRLQEGEDPAEAALDAFGDLEQLEQALAAYVQEGRFRTLRIPTTPPGQMTGKAGSDPRPHDGVLTIRSLSAAQSLAARAAFLVNGLRPEAARPLLTEALTLDPGEPTLLETLGHFHFQQNDPAEAARWFDRAIATGRASHLPYFYRAILVGPVPGPSGTEGDMGARERLLRRTIALAPEFAPAYARLADVYDANVWSRELALPLILRAVELEADNPGYWVTLGRLLVRLNRPDEAREAGRRGLEQMRLASSRELVEAFLAELAGPPGPTAGRP